MPTLKIKENLIRPSWIQTYTLPWYRRILLKLIGRPFIGKLYIAFDPAPKGSFSVTTQIKDGKVFVIDVKRHNG